MGVNLFRLERLRIDDAHRKVETRLSLAQTQQLVLVRIEHLLVCRVCKALHDLEPFVSVRQRQTKDCNRDYRTTYRIRGCLALIWKLAVSP